MAKTTGATEALTEQAESDSEHVSTRLARYVGDGSVYQSGVPHERDITTDDNLSEELIDLAVETGTHERV